MVRLASKVTLLISSLFLFGCEDPQQKIWARKIWVCYWAVEKHKARTTHSHP